MDMEDVLLLAAGLLAEDERVAAQVRRQYSWFVVDEFQDVSPLQSALLDLWLGGRDEICVVGDPAQTIYSFAGANAAYLTGFAAQAPGRHLRRAGPQLPLHAADGERRQPAAGRVAQHRGRAAAERAAGPEVRYSRHPDEVAEAEAVAARIAALRAGGTPLSEMAVLFRINAQSEPFEDALAAQGVPYVVRGAARFFERAEVRQAVTLLRGAARSGRPASTTAGSTRSPRRCAPCWPAWAGRPRRPAGAVRRRTAGSRCRRWSTRPPSVAARAPRRGLAGFVADLERRASEQHAPVADGVTLATLHAAKGLEWDVVFVCGLQEGTLPIVYADSPERGRGGAAAALRRDDPGPR